ncbi:phage tail protein [Streptomyces platensis]|uniref:phage tail protein n=1 Tax=Streptomyces platensis TaxID=58346 RepID=UPI003C2FFE3E
MLGNGAVAAAGRTQPGPPQPPAAEPVPAEAAAASGGAPEVTARPGPDADPKFATLKKDVRHKKRSVAASHPPPRTESAAAQDAARPPKDDEEAQGKTANAEKMNEAKPKDFDKDAFIRAVEKAIAEKAPKNLDEADKFADSGKADEVRAEVHGKVGEGKTDSAEQIATTTAAPPDTSAAVPKKVVPMTPDRPPGTPGTPNPANAVPDKLPASATDLSAGPARVDRQMADAQVTETQLKKSNEPTFKNALGEKKAAERHSEVAPGRMRGHEKKELRAATAQAQRLGAAAMGAIGAQRVRTGQQVGAGKTGAKGRDEEKRAQVTAILQGVFDTMKKDVETILDGLDKLVDDQFGKEEKAARDAFTAEHKRKMDEYKDRRYSGWTGKARWVRDLFAGLPAEADKIFEEARDNYVRRMRQVISDVADTIGGELNRAKRRIAQGRTELQAAVRKLPADLRSIGQQAAAEFTDKFDELTQSVDDKGTQLVDTLATKYTDALKSVDDEIAAEKEKNKGLVAKAVDAVKSVINTIMELKRLLLSVLAKAASAIMLILKDPIGFLRNLVSAVGAGLKQFLANIGRHLQQGIMSWLLGKTAEAGIELPSKFDAQGVLKMLASLLGLTWQNIRSRIVRKVPKMEPAVAAAETAIPLVSEVRKRGVAGMWDELKTRVGDLKKDLLDKVIAYVTPTIIQAGIMWVLSLLNPASAFVRAVKLIIDIVRFIVTQARQIFEFVNAVLDAVIAIARGGSGGVPGLIERALARSIPVLLGVLAAILGVGGIAAKVKQIVQAMSKPVNRAIDWVIDKIVGLVKKLWAKIKSKFEKKKPKPKPKHRPDRKRPAKQRRRRPTQRRRPDRGRPKPRRDPKKKRADKRPKKDMLRALDAGVREATRLLDAEGATEESVRKGLPAIKQRHRLTQIQLEQAAPGTYFVTVAINPKKRTSYRDLFPYKIGRAKKPIDIRRHPYAAVQLHPITQPIKGNDRWIGFVVNMAAIPDEIRKNPKVALRYLDHAWAGTGATHAQDLAEARTAVVIGINTFERLNPQGGDPVRDAIGSVDRRPELRVAVFGFVWTPRWVKGNDAVDIAVVRAAYQKLNSRHKKRAEANEKGLRDKEALPYGLFREEVIRSEYTRTAMEILREVNNQVHIVSQDADTGVATISGLGVLRAYEKVLSEMERHPLLTIGGYHFKHFDWGRHADNRAKQLTLLANELDRAIREAIAKQYPQMLYPTEPNMLVKAWDKVHGDGIFQNARTKALLEAGNNARSQGKLFDVGSAEGRNFRNKLMKTFGTDFSVVYAPDASTSTSPLPKDRTRGLTVRPWDVLMAAKGRMRGKKWWEAIRVSHRMYALIIQSQSNASAHTLAREFSRAIRVGEDVRVELQNKIFVHVEDVAMLMSDNPRLTADSPVIQARLKKLEKDAATLINEGADQGERYQRAVQLAHETTNEIISAMTAPELTALWHRIQRALDDVTKPRRRGGRR